METLFQVIGLGLERDEIYENAYIHFYNYQTKQVNIYTITV